MMRRLRAPLFVALALLTMAALVLQRVPALASEVDDTTDQHGLGPYDQFACNGAEEDELDTGDESNSFFPPFKVEFNSQNDDGGGSLTGGFEFQLSDEEVSQSFNRDAAAGSQPRVLLQVTPTEPRPGDEVAVIAALADFADDSTSSNRQAAVAFAINDTSLQGVLAGATELPESGSPCGVVTRTPQTDSDGDGMDDGWEQLHGLDPSDPGDAFEDPDNDSSARFFTNADGEELVITPSTGGGDAGVMNNKAEYDWGTDPRRADTDKDGISDGDEVLGFGGATVTFTNEIPVGEQFTVRAYAAGTSLMSDAFTEFTPIVKLDSSTKTVASSNGEHLRGEAVTDEPFTVPGETVRVQARFIGTEGEPSSFDYTYIVDGAEVENPISSRDVFEFPMETGRTPGSRVSYEIRAVNTSTGQLAVLRGAARVGEDVTLQATPPDPVPGEPVTILAVLASGSDPSAYLFEWRINGELDEPASGVGRSGLTLSGPASGDLEIDVQLFAVADGQLTGSAATTLGESSPRVEVALVPEEPVAGDQVTGIARAGGFALNLDTDGDGVFDATQLTYDWVVDGTALPPDTNAAGISTVKLSAGGDGTTHELSVRVRSTGTNAQAASGQASFTTLPGGLAFGAGVQEGPARGGNLLAAAVAALPSNVRWVAVGVAVVGAGLGSVLLTRKRRQA